MTMLLKTLGYAAVAATLLTGTSAPAADRPKFTVGYVVYVGFMPWAWAKSEGVMEKWGDKYGIEINLVPINDYVAGINQFIAGEMDAITLAGMDALAMPAAAGIDTSIFLMHDYSNGNDAIISRSAPDLKALVGEEVWLLQYSVLHYVLNRGLSLAGITAPSAVKTTNISDSEVAAAWLTQADIKHAGAWNPALAEMVAGVEGAKVLFSSADIPGEVMDVMAGHTDRLAKSPELGKALTGAWYEAMSVLQGEDSPAMTGVMAAAMGTNAAGFAAQLDATQFLYTPAEAVAFLTSERTGETMDLIRNFSFGQGLLGSTANSADDIGIQLGDGRILGSAANVKLRFDPSFARLAAAGDL